MSNTAKRSLISAKNLIRDVFRQLRDGEIQLVAAALAFSTALSIIPFLAVSLTAFQSFGGFEALYPKVESLILSNFKEVVGSDVSNFIRKAIARTQIETIGVMGVLILIFTSLRMVYDMETGLNRIWNQ